MPKKTTLKKSDSVFLILGDSFLAEEKVKSLIASIQNQNKGRQGQTVTHRLTEMDLDQVLSEARTLPFLVDYQIFHLKGAESLKEKKIKTLESYTDNPAENAYLILEGEALDRRSSLAKLLEKKGEVIVVDDQQKKSEGSKFIQQKLKAAGKSISPGLVTRIVDGAGDVPAVLESILNQLISYAGEASQITAEMVSQCEEDWREVDVFQLVNAIAGKKTGVALSLLKNLLGDNEYEVIGLLGILHWQMRRYWLAKALLEEGHSERDVLRKLRISPKQAPYFVKQVRMFKLSTLQYAIENLFQLDWKAKTGRAHAIMEMERWVVGVTS